MIAPGPSTPGFPAPRQANSIAKIPGIDDSFLDLIQDVLKRAKLLKKMRTPAENPFDDSGDWIHSVLSRSQNNREKAGTTFAWQGPGSWIPPGSSGKIAHIE